MSVADAWPQILEFFGTPLVIEPSPGQLSSDAGRGESENRHKEFKCDLAMDRLSDHRFVANYFRLYLHAGAMNLLVRQDSLQRRAFCCTGGGWRCKQ